MSKFTKYQVALDPVGRHVEIIPDDGKASTGHSVVGSFEANYAEQSIKGEKDFDTKGDHLFIAKAKSILEDLEIKDFQNMVYEDKVSNAPTGESYIPTIKEVEQAVRDGQNPADYRTEVSENLDKAEAENEKTGTKHKNDAKHRGEG